MFTQLQEKRKDLILSETPVNGLILEVDHSYYRTIVDSPLSSSYLYKVLALPSSLLLTTFLQRITRHHLLFMVS